MKKIVSLALALGLVGTSVSAVNLVDSERFTKANAVSKTLSANDKELLFGAKNVNAKLLSDSEMNNTTGEWFGKLFRPNPRPFCMFCVVRK